MPLRKTDHVTVDELAYRLVDWKFDDHSYFTTVSLKPFLYKESFRNQFTMVQKELKEFLQKITQEAILTTELTKSNNVHFHIILRSDLTPIQIDDYVKNFNRLGNTLTKKCIIRNNTIEWFTNDDNVLLLNDLQYYMLKQYNETDELLNGVYNDYEAVASSYTHYDKKPNLRKLKIVSLDNNVIEDDMDFISPTPIKIQISKPNNLISI